MNYYVILIFSNILLFACSSTNQDRIINHQDKDKFISQNQLDSTKIIAAIRPSGYPWNTEGRLTDVSRPLQHRDTTENLYPNAISPTTQICFKLNKSDSVKFYLCNTDESSCIKIEDALLDSGIYCLGFQKLDFSGILEYKLITRDTIFTKKIIFKR